MSAVWALAPIAQGGPNGLNSKNARLKSCHFVPHSIPSWKPFSALAIRSAAGLHEQMPAFGRSSFTTGCLEFRRQALDGRTELENLSPMAV